MELATSRLQKSAQSNTYQSSHKRQADDQPCPDTAAANETKSPGEQSSVYTYPRPAHSLEDILSECLRIQTHAELDWFIRWRCLPWLSTDCLITGFAEFNQQECDLKVFRQVTSQQGTRQLLARADTEHLLRVFIRKWRNERKAVQISVGSYSAHTVFASTFARFFPDAQALIFNVQKDMCSPAISFVLIDQCITPDPRVYERLSLLMPHLQGALVRMLKNERRERNATLLTELSSRERELLRSIAQGHTDEEIARSTQRSIHTIKNRVRQILMRYGFANRVQAVAAGFAASIFGPMGILKNAPDNED
jgi:DNA-binding CsgD family transcriptional regulator